ncbi:hypothetical protein [Streptodolium elevatio]|uniref:Secreted protein n=1 Tax=Streptodolium elevatio TaxID=3157996 RepID=A0ABV3DPW9_9ACTN
MLMKTLPVAAQMRMRTLPWSSLTLSTHAVGDSGSRTRDGMSVWYWSASTKVSTAADAASTRRMRARAAVSSVR